LKKAKQNERELASKNVQESGVLLGKQHVQIFAPFLVKPRRASQFDYDDLLCLFEKSKAKLDNLLLKAGTTFPRK
jgi:hypothetical protein